MIVPWALRRRFAADALAFLLLFSALLGGAKLHPVGQMVPQSASSSASTMLADGGGGSNNSTCGGGVGTHC